LKTVTAKELKELDPKQFQKQYYAWQEYAVYDDWADWIKENFEADMRCEGIKVDKFTWDIGYSQSDGAAFDGHVIIYEWMEANPQYIERYPALYIACKQDGSYMTLRTNNRGFYMHTNIVDHLYETAPEGVFSMLDEDAWTELVIDQWDRAGLEGEMKSTCESYMKDMYYKLRDEYENTTSEEAFIESCECNEVTFEIEGEECEI